MLDPEDAEDPKPTTADPGEDMGDGDVRPARPAEAGSDALLLRGLILHVLAGK